MPQLNEINDKTEDINFFSFLLLLWNKKLFIILITSLFIILSIIYALSLPNIYKSSALLASSEDKNSISSKVSTFSSLASFSGIDLSQNNSKVQEAIERIRSYSFFSEYFLPNIKLENLMAVKSWDSNEDIIKYQNSLYDAKTNSWIRDASDPKKRKPSSQEAYRQYKRILSIKEDKKSGFVEISIVHQSPIIARNWVNLINKSINETMRQIDIKSAENSINFLTKSQDNANLQSAKEMIADLLESQIQILMLAYSNDSYIFKVIDSPIVSEVKSAPNRLIIVILGTVFGMILSLIIVLTGRLK